MRESGLFSIDETDYNLGYGIEKKKTKQKKKALKEFVKSTKNRESQTISNYLLGDGNIKKGKHLRELAKKKVRKGYNR